MTTPSRSFNTLKERALVAGGVLAGCLAFGAVAKEVATPTALLVSAAAAAALTRVRLISNEDLIGIPTRYMPPPQWALPYEEMAAGFARQLGLPKAPTIAILAEREARSDIESRYSKQKGTPVLEHKVRHYLSADCVNNKIHICEAMEKVPAGQSRFFIAHEVAHLHNDRKSAHAIAGSMINVSTLALMTGCAIQGAVDAFAPSSVSFDVVQAGSPLLGAMMLLGGRNMAQLGISYANRVAEKRADRVGMLLANDMGAARAELTAIMPDDIAQKPSRSLNNMGQILSALRKSHPQPERRLAALEHEFGSSQTAVKPAASPLKLA